MFGKLILYRALSLPRRIHSTLILILLWRFHTPRFAKDSIHTTEAHKVCPDAIRCPYATLASTVNCHTASTHTSTFLQHVPDTVIVYTAGWQGSSQSWAGLDPLDWPLACCTGLDWIGWPLACLASARWTWWLIAHVAMTVVVWLVL